MEPTPSRSPNWTGSSCASRSDIRIPLRKKKFSNGSRTGTTTTRQMPSWIQRSSCFFKSKAVRRSEEHTSELQSLTNLVCRLLLEKKKNNKVNNIHKK